MVRYLSDDWLQRASDALAEVVPLDVALTVGFVVSGGPDGERRYSLRLGPGPVAMVPGCEEAVVVLSQSWDTAREVAAGDRSAQRAFLEGDIRLEGDVRALLGHQAQLSVVEDHLASMRADTTF